MGQPLLVPALLMSGAALHAHLVASAPEASPGGVAQGLPATAAAFARFGTAKASVSGEWMVVESTGLPEHPMMAGITSWQQQIPLPQPYKGANAWKIPLHPTKAAAPTPLRDRFLRGAVALAANGIPIFNPQNNRGEISQDIGELDRWGGHCGRADDYHYHIIPLHLAERTGDALPVAFALDGYPVYGLREPDGKPMRPLDACGGHDDPVHGYHYHGTGKTPYVFAAFRGKVTEAGGQVDPQPRAEPIRPAGEPLRGATLLACEKVRLPEGEGWRLDYSHGGRKLSLRWVARDAEVLVWFADAKEPTVFRRGGGKGRGDRARPPR